MTPENKTENEVELTEEELEAIIISYDEYLRANDISYDEMTDEKFDSLEFKDFETKAKGFPFGTDTALPKFELWKEGEKKRRAAFAEIEFVIEEHAEDKSSKIKPFINDVNNIYRNAKGDPKVTVGDLNDKLWQMALVRSEKDAVGDVERESTDLNDKLAEDFRIKYPEASVAMSQIYALQTDTRRAEADEQETPGLFEREETLQRVQEELNPALFYFQSEINKTQAS